jgi:cell division protein FtsB
VTEAEDGIIEQAKWGMSRTDEVVVKLVAAVKQQRQQLTALNARVKALEDAAK